MFLFLFFSFLFFINFTIESQYNGLGYLVTEYCPYGTLQRLLDSGTISPCGTCSPPEESTCKSIIAQIAKAVSFLHSIGIIHRDIKPENIFVMQLNPIVIRLADFDRSTIIKPCDKMGRSQIMSEIEGSPYYMAPEVLVSSKEGYTANRYFSVFFFHSFSFFF